MCSLGFQWLGVTRDHFNPLLPEQLFITPRISELLACKVALDHKEVGGLKFLLAARNAGSALSRKPQTESLCWKYTLEINFVTNMALSSWPRILGMMGLCDVKNSVSEPTLCSCNSQACETWAGIPQFKCHVGDLSKILFSQPRPHNAAPIIVTNHKYSVLLQRQLLDEACRRPRKTSLSCDAELSYCPLGAGPKSQKAHGGSAIFLQY